MKQTIEGLISEYTEENLPPPWQTYLITNDPKSGNVHIVQKVFEGPFEFDVIFTPSTATKTATSDDLTKASQAAVLAFGEKYMEKLNIKY